MNPQCTPGQRASSEALRKEGNGLFQRAKYAAAAERYTEAIALDPGNAALYVNRALALKKSAAPAGGAADLWSRVAGDAASALAIDAQHMKASYLLGVALREQGADLPRAITNLARALEHAREKDDAIKDEIWRELAKTQDAAWRAESAARRGEVEALRSQLRALAKAASAPADGEHANSSSSGGSGSANAARGDMGAACGGGGCGALEVDWQALDRVFDRAARGDMRGEVPSAFTCPLTMEVFRDPVTSKSGHTYERAALTEHLTKVGGWDPITRVAMTLADVRPNIAMRNAVSLYLEEHPWAWHECY